MQIIHGFFEGTGADLYLQLGSVPEHIDIWNLGAATVETYSWNKCMIHDILTTEGLGRPKGGGAVVDMAFGEGIAPYRGGELLTTSNQTDLTYGGGVYIERDDKDYRYYTNAAAGITGDASTEDIVTWHLDTAATPTGHFNGSSTTQGDVTGTYIGAGSLIRVIDTNNNHTYEAAITALTGGTGAAANEVTLSEAVPSGNVTFIGGMYGFIPTAVGKTTKAGVFISNTTLNENGKTLGFCALLAG